MNPCVFLHSSYAHMEMCLSSHITCLLLSAKTCLANVLLTGIKCYSWLFWIIWEENRKTAVMEIASGVLKDVFWAASPSYRESDSAHATKAISWPRETLQVSLEFKATVPKCSLSPARGDKSRLLWQNVCGDINLHFKGTHRRDFVIKLLLTL